MRIHHQILLTLGVVTLLPTGALVLFSYHRTAREIQQGVDRGMLAAAERTAAHVQGYLVASLEEMRSLANLPVLHRALLAPDTVRAGAVSDLMRMAIDRDPVNAIGCALLDRHGHVVADTVASQVGSDESQQAWFRNTSGSAVPTVTIARADGVPGPVLTIGSTLRDANGDQLGSLRLHLDPSCLQQLLSQSVSHAEQATQVLCDANGQVLADARSPQLRFAAERLQRPAGAGDGIVRPLAWFLPDATRLTNGHAVTTSFEVVPWQITVWQDDVAYHAPIDHLLQNMIVQSSVAALLVMVAAALASLLVARPIQRLERAAAEIADGNLTIAIPDAPGEIGSLGRTLHAMCERLLTTMANLQVAAADAQVASRAKSQFLANMSHELRTPMTAILGYAEVLVEDPTLSGEVRDQVATVLRNARHLLELVNEVLDLAKVEAGTMELDPVDFAPAELLTSITDLLQGQARAKGITLTVAGADLPARLHGDQHRLRQILLNLVGNAVKFTERGGVTVHATVTGHPRGHLLTCAVTDTGSGIPADRLRDLFQPFAQVDSSMSRRHGGTGLGLSLSQKLAHLLGGEITVTTAAGVGSTFTLRVPLEPAAASDPTESLGPRRGQALRGRILLVEDGQDNQRLFAHVLRKAGAEVTLAEHGLDALRALGREQDPDGPLQEPAPFDLVLMDMQMPVLDGYEATRRLRQKGCRLPIVALTAHAMQDARAECLDAGCDACATKPIAGRALVQLCATWLASGSTTPRA